MRPQRSLMSILMRPARLVPSKVALIDVSDHPYCKKPHTYSWSEVSQRVTATARFLLKQGLDRSDTVGVLAYNSHHYFELFFAVPTAGARIVPLNYRLGDEELKVQVAEAELSILVSDQRFFERARSLQEKVPSIGRVLSTESEEWEKEVSTREVDCAIRMNSHNELDLLGDKGGFGFSFSEDELVGIFYTGGASGRAKGVMLTHRNLYDATLQICLAMGYNENDIYLHAGPMFHLADAAGSLSCTLLGATHVFLPNFNPEGFIDAVNRFGVTTVTMVPTMYRMLLDSASLDIPSMSSLRRIFYSAAPMPEAMLREIFDVFPCGIGQGYGMTEASSRITVMPPEIYRAVIEGYDPRRHLLASAGKEVPGLEVKIMRDDGGIAGPKEIGEIVVSGTVVMKGYWKRPDLTGQVLEDGWLHTGDLGYLDEEGHLYVVDRLKDMIITGGENVYSLEVENVLCSHPEVAEVAVIGVPDELWGERVHAVVVPKSGGRLDVAQLQAYCRSRIASYKTPKSIEFVDSLPRSAAGKVLKDSLRRRFVP